MTIQMQIRIATADDWDAVHRIRSSVTENRLSDPSRVGRNDYVDHLERRGRGWVAETAIGIVGFAIADASDGSVWALFVDPRYEGGGVGRALHDVMVTWMFGTGLRRLQLGTDPGTRAERFYRNAGWRPTGLADNGEQRFELQQSWWIAAR